MIIKRPLNIKEGEENKTMEPKKLRTIELLITDDFDKDKVDYISLVDDPAIQVDWVAFSNKEIKPYKFKVTDESQHKLVGPLMIPNQKIYRNNRDNEGNITEEWNVVFSEKSIENASKKYFANGFNKNVNINHDEKVDGVCIMESWIIQDPECDKAKLYGFGNLPKGTWMATFHVKNDDIWEGFIKTGKLLGFSVEGLFIQGEEVFSRATEEEDFNEEEIELINKTIEFLLRNPDKLGHL